jgi:hypothetical protein
MAHAGEVRDVDITISEGCVLSGIVTDKEGNPLPRVLVNAEERMTAGSNGDPIQQTDAQTQTDEEGRFQLPHAPKGAVLVRGYDGDHAVTTETVQIAECEKLAPMKLIMSHGGGIAGVARRADGSPLAGAKVSVMDRAVGFVNTISDREGHFHFDALPVGITRLQLDHEGQRAMQIVPVKEDETMNVDMTLFGEGTAELRGHVTAGGRPIRGARIVAVANHGNEGGLGLYFLVTDAEGAFRLPSVSEGGYLVTLMSTAVSRGVLLKAGEVETVDLDAGFVPPSRPPRRPRQAAATPTP